MLQCQNKTGTQCQFWHFSINKTAQLPAIRIPEQPILLTRSKINRTGYKYSLKVGSQISYSSSFSLRT